MTTIMDPATMLPVETGTSLEERVSRLEAGYEHLATKADVADLRAEFKSDLAELRSEVQRSDAATQAAFDKLRVEMQVRDTETKALIAAVISEMQRRDEVMHAVIEKLQAEMNARDAVIREEIGKIRTDNAENKAKIIQWAVGTIIAVAAIATTIGVALTGTAG